MSTLVATLAVGFVLALTVAAYTLVCPRPRPSDFCALVGPFVVWGLLMETSGRPKGLTNVEVEIPLVVSCIAVGFFGRATLRPVFPAPVSWLLLPATTSLAAAAIFFAVPTATHADWLSARLYVYGHPELDEASRSAILGGVVLPGMSSSEAAAAGGNGGWMTTGGILQVRTFVNRSQYASDHPVVFRAYFVDNRVEGIEPMVDPTLCSVPQPVEAATYPYVGFWKEDCQETFGLRLTAGGAGRYGVAFCGPGGCGAVNECTEIPSRAYQLAKTETISLRAITGRLYERCAP